MASDVPSTCLPGKPEGAAFLFVSTGPRGGLDKGCLRALREAWCSVGSGSAGGDARSACSRRRADHAGVLSGRCGRCPTSRSSPPSGTVRWVRGSSRDGSGAVAPVGDPSGSWLLVPTTVDAFSLRAALPRAALSSVSLRTSAGPIRTETRPVPGSSDVLGGSLPPRSLGLAGTRSGAVFPEGKVGWLASQGGAAPELRPGEPGPEGGRARSALSARSPSGGRHRTGPAVFGGQPSGWHRRPGGCSLSAVGAGRLPLEAARPRRGHSAGARPTCGSFGGASEATPVRLRRPDACRGSFCPRGGCWAECPSESALEEGS